MSDGILRWVLALLNALGVVGVGTFLAGHRKTGITQMVISISSFSLTIIPMFLFYRETSGAGEGMLQWYLALLRGERWESGGLFWLALACFGVLLFGLNWLWGWTTTRPNAKAPPPLPANSKK